MSREVLSIFIINQAGKNKSTKKKRNISVRIR